MNELLFSGGRLEHALQAQAAKMREAVDAEPEESLKQADVDQWSAALRHHFLVACPELKVDEVWMEPPKDVTLDVSRAPERYFSVDAYLERAETRHRLAQLGPGE